MSEAPSPLPAQINALLTRGKAWLSSLSRSAKILTGATIVSLALILGVFAFRATHETYVPLFTQLDREDAGSLVAKLKELKVPYKLENDGTSITVPESKVHELRLELAAAGLPRGGSVGFESFDKMKLGATEFEQKVLFRRALEGELARSVGSIAAIQSARVHLVLPERSVFITKTEPASASIVVKLRPGRTVSASEVSAIVHLAATAVPGLAGEHVSLVTTEGAVLHRPSNGDGELDHDSRAAALESALESRVRSMLEKVLGPGHVDVRVSADLDLAKIERLEDHYDPVKIAIRSETKTTEHTGGAGGDSVAGVPGAESNLPTGVAASGSASATPPPVAAVGGPIRESYTKNYEVDHVSEKKLITSGVLKRLAVAVAIDDHKVDPTGKTVLAPKSPEELAKIALLVKSAVGADEKRGDLVTVESMSFPEPEAMGNLAGAPTAGPDFRAAWAAFMKLPVKARIGIGAGAGLLFLFLAFKLRRKVAKKEEDPKALKAGEIPSQVLGAGEVPALTERNEDDLRLEAHGRAASDPATAALVLRYWLGANAEPATAETKAA